MQGTLQEISEKGSEVIFMSKPEHFVATILEDHKITIPISPAKIKKIKKGKMFRFTIIDEVKQ
jgi:hypothetical protein